MKLMTNAAVDGPGTEEHLRNLWQRTFSRVASALEDWLERIFILRGRAFIESLYPDRAQRSRLYRYGYYSDQERPPPSDDLRAWQRFAIDNWSSGWESQSVRQWLKAWDLASPTGFEPVLSP
jgi:hypothetical protein